MKKKILLLFCAICFVLPFTFMFTGCNNKIETYNVNFDYGQAASFFETNTTSVSVNSNEWITSIPNIKDEYKDSFLGWFVKGSDTEIKNNSFIGADCILEARFDINNAQSGLYQNGKYIMTWEEIDWVNANKLLVGDLVIDSSVTTINYGQFMNCEDLTSVVIPDSVENIGGAAFKNCSSLKNIRLSKNVHDIKADTFANCLSLKNFTIDEHITQISGGAFADCLNLNTVTVCGNVKVDGNNNEYGYSVFKGCTSLRNVIINEGVTVLDRILFGCENILQINLPYTLETIVHNAFEGCSSIKELFIPSNVSATGTNILKGCEAIDTFVLYEKLGYKWQISCEVTNNEWADVDTLTGYQLLNSLKIDENCALRQVSI